MSPRVVHGASLLAALVSAAACSSSSGSGSPGDADASAIEAGVDAAPEPPEDDAGSGTAWPDLYRDLFGPTGRASCAGDGACHGAPNQAGAISASGFVCADETGCRTKMLEAGLVKLPGDASDPSSSVLVKVLRKRNADGSLTGFMPKRPAYVFSRTSIGRIETWTANGAKAD
jgi:hypothetical protein